MLSKGEEDSLYEMFVGAAFIGDTEVNCADEFRCSVNIRATSSWLDRTWLVDQLSSRQQSRREKAAFSLTFSASFFSLAGHLSSCL